MIMTKNTNTVVESIVVSKTIQELGAEALVRNANNKSKSIRELAAGGMKTGDIAKSLGIRYQFARNVLNQLVKAK